MIPQLEFDGRLPPGIHSATLAEIESRCGQSNATRKQLYGLLKSVVQASLYYETIKRILVWGSFASSKEVPGDLDYSIVVSVEHHRTNVRSEHRRFLVPYEARRYYGVDRGFLVVRDYPIEDYADSLDFILRDRKGTARGVLEIELRGEVKG